MFRILRKTALCANEKAYTAVKQSKRFAGHSKWQNIKHIKAENDAERALLFQRFTQQMKIAIAEGGSPKPAENVRLAQVIELARKKNMPVAKINSILERAAASPSKTSSAEFRGPGGSAVMVDFITDNPKVLKPALNTIVKKTSVTSVESGRNIFDHKGYILTEHKGDISTATDDAIAVEAEEVEEINVDNTSYFQFTCDSTEIPKVVNLLSKRGYNVVSSEDQWIPKVLVSLSDEDAKKLDNFYTRLRALQEVTRITDNVE